MKQKGHGVFINEHQKKTEASFEKNQKNQKNFSKKLQQNTRLKSLYMRRVVFGRILIGEVVELWRSTTNQGQS